MCRECLQHPCDSRCPNAPQPKIVTYCYECGSEICEGEEYYQIGKENICSDCVKYGKRIAEEE